MTHWSRTGAWGALALAATLGVARAQQDVPAPQHRAEEAAKEHARESAPPKGEGEGEDPSLEFPVHYWEMPEVRVAGRASPALREEQRIGDYQQPRWTSVRVFPTTRVYVVPSGQVEFEYWLTVKDDGRNAKERVIESQYEFEFGLGHRVQLDLYLVAEQVGDQGTFALSGEKIELRYALADWGELWGNPAVYLEYSHNRDAPDKLEGKLLLGWELAPGVHAGLNVVFERELSGPDQGQEGKLTFGIGYAVLDSVLSIGAEAFVEAKDVRHDRWDLVTEIGLGPSISWHPVEPAHVLITPLAVTELDDSRGTVEDYQAEVTVVLGWAF